MDSRPLGGIDKVISKTLASFIKGDTSELPEYMIKKRSAREKDE